MALTLKGGVTGALQEVEANTLAGRVSPRPVDPGALGAYRQSLASGTIAAGLAGSAPVFAFRYGGANICVLKQIRVSMGDLVGFTAGLVVIGAFVARAFTAMDTGGTSATLSGNSAKLRTGFATTGVSAVMIANTGALTPGTRTLDTNGFAALATSVITTAGQPIVPAPVELYRALPGDDPLEFATSEGFVLTATVPATGTWQLAVDYAWAEYPVGSGWG